MASTKLANLIDPQVIADFVDQKLIDNIVFAPLAEIDQTLVGRPGDTLDCKRLAVEMVGILQRIVI